jgi:murein DD-endopeptidase MepM/ murein hydrolase activator NlpD
VALVLTFLIALSLSLVRFDSLARVASGAADLSVGPAMEFNVAGASPGMRAYQRDRSQTRITRRADPHTAIPSRPRLEIVTYRVQPGDTTESIAEQFGLDPTTIMWSNPEIEKAPDLLKVGQELVILPLDGVYHTVEEGDTLDDIVETYEVPIQEIVNCPFNNLPLDGELRAGTRIVVPGGTKPYVPREVTTYGGPVPEDIAGTGLFRWPASGYISQGYWYGHRAVDVANAIGAAILASDGGYVSFTGWTDVGYGYLVVLDHANGYRTYYAHLNDYFVVEGQAVEAGQVIGEMGSTGNSTGPHLHFEVRYNGYPTNPLVYLP